MLASLLQCLVWSVSTIAMRTGFVCFHERASVRALTARAPRAPRARRPLSVRTRLSLLDDARLERGSHCIGVTQHGEETV